MLLNVLQASSGTSNFSLQVYMEPKQDRVYSRGRSKYVTPSKWMVIGSDDESGLEYVPPGTLTPTCAARTTKATPMKVAPGGVTTS